MNRNHESHCLGDILRQPGELRECLDQLLGPDRASLERAAAIVRESPEVYVAGMGASWSAGIGAQEILAGTGRAAVLADASELLHQPAFRPRTGILLLSRSGKSVEVVTLVDRASQLGARVVGITNDSESPLALRSQASVLMDVGFDHAISVVTYSSIALGAGLVAAEATGSLDASETRSLRQGLEELPEAITGWRSQLAGNPWFSAGGPTYFLARGASLASAHTARLLWEETAKTAATALTTGGFRHGPQEIIEPGFRVGLWVDPSRRRDADLALARDLRSLGVRVMAIGQAVPPEAGDLVFQLPTLPPRWQFVADIVPVQLAAEHLAGLRGMDCDSFRLSSHVVTSEGGLFDPSRPRG